MLSVVTIGTGTCVMLAEVMATVRVAPEVLRTMNVWFSPVLSGNRPALSVSTICLGIAIDGICPVDLQDLIAALELASPPATLLR